MFAVLIATFIAAALVHAAVLPPSGAAHHVNAFLTDMPIATEEVLSTAAHAYRPAGSVRSVAQLTVPAGTHWEAEVSSGSVLLTVASGALQVAVSDGTASVVHPSSGAKTFYRLAPDALVTLVASDRLVMRGRGLLLAENVGQDPVVAAVIRVK